MQNLFTRIAMLVIAFGFFISCTPRYESTLSTSTELTVDELLDRAAEIRQSNPDDPEANQLEALAHLRTARTKAPNLRENDYKAMKMAFDKALSGYDTQRNSSNERSKIAETIESAWSYEHNIAAGIVSSDSSGSNQQLSLAATHAHNAIIIIPDSLISYELLADTYARMGNIDMAINVLSFADSTLPNHAGRLHESLAFLYYNKGDFENSVKWYENALSWNRSQIANPSDPSIRELTKGSLLNTWHGLINATIAARQTDIAIASLEEITQTYPSNTTYKMLLSRQLVTRIGEHFESNESTDRGIIINTLDQIGTISATDPEFKLNNALSLSEIAGRVIESRLQETESFDAASNLDIMLVCESAIQLYKEVLEIDPTNPSAISGIADIYLLIDNESEASKWYELLD
ncbi:MAG TPA: hypothetical protein DCE78_05960 [Bacteroidetes bacterium]|nr:hypothetical protein [Bacteroidota bacterium]